MAKLIEDGELTLSDELVLADKEIARLLAELSNGEIATLEICCENDRLRAENARLIERCAKIAETHKGSAASRRRLKGQQFKFMSEEVVSEIQAEERGEDIASEMIARKIRALAAAPASREDRCQK
jgi:regulator of replication initiation timing